LPRAAATQAWPEWTSTGARRADATSSLAWLRGVRRTAWAGLDARRCRYGAPEFTPRCAPHRWSMRRFSLELHLVVLLGRRPVSPSCATIVTMADEQFAESVFVRNALIRTVSQTATASSTSPRRLWRTAPMGRSLKTSDPRRYVMGGANNWQIESISDYLECALAGVGAQPTWNSSPSAADLALARSAPVAWHGLRVA
jgi:hypothetical protein